jgi:ABC-type lipoprotein release transport system permease subunit
VQMSLSSAGVILMLTIVMSIVAGLLAVRKVAIADPAELY